MFLFIPLITVSTSLITRLVINRIVSIVEKVAIEQSK